MELDFYKRRKGWGHTATTLAGVLPGVSSSRMVLEVYFYDFSQVI